MVGYFKKETLTRKCVRYYWTLCWITCVVKEAFIVNINLAQGPLAKAVGLGQDPLFEIVDEVARPDPFKFFLEFIDHIPARLGHQQIFDTGLKYPLEMKIRIKTLP